MVEESNQKGAWVPVTPAKSVTGMPDTDHTGDMSYVEALYVKGDQVNNQNNGVGLDFEKFPNVPENQSPEKRRNNRSNLNEKSRKRMKMKRHRPKVLNENKPKRTPKTKVAKSTTPKPQTPERAVPRTRQAEKRKLLRMNNLKPLEEHSKDVGHVTTSGSSEYTKTSCKQKLDFDFEKDVINQSDTTKPEEYKHEHDDQMSKVDVEVDGFCLQNFDTVTGFSQMQDGFQVPRTSYDGGLAADIGYSFQEIAAGNIDQTLFLRVYQRRFQPNDCLKKSRKLGPNFPKMLKRKRTSRKKIIAPHKFCIPTKTQGHTVVEFAKYMNQMKIKGKKMSSIRNDELSSLEMVGMILPTERQRSLAINLLPIVTIRKKRSQLHDLFNLSSLVRRKRSNTFTRRRENFCLVNDVLGTSILKHSTNGIPNSEGYKDEASEDVQDDENRTVTTKSLIEVLELPADGYKDEASEALELPLDNYAPCRGNILQDPAKSVPGNVFSRHKKIKKVCLSDNSFQLIPRRFPPNLERDYVLSSRDDKSFVEALITFAIRRLGCLHIDGSCSQLARDQKGNGALVPFKGKLDLPKKRKPLPKVHLDAETIRVWNLLTENTNGIGNAEEIENDRKEYWEKEREVFRGRMELFISRMHQIQGDRRFSKWKGSVVDSVVGVFLTQNVTDQLSSSAFMSLVARFPAPSVNTNGTQDATDSTVAHPEQSDNLNNDQQSLFLMEQVTNNTQESTGIKLSHPEQSANVNNDPQFFPMEQVISSSQETIGSNLAHEHSANVNSDQQSFFPVKQVISCSQESDGGNLASLEQSANINNEQPYFFQMKLTTNDQIAGNASETYICTTNEMVTSLMEDEVIVEDETTYVKCQLEDKVTVEDETDSVKCQMEDKRNVEDEITFLKCQIEDDGIVEDETTSVKHQESAMMEKCPSSSFVTQVEVESNNGGNNSSQSESTLGKKSGKVEDKQENKIDWDELRRTYKMDRDSETTDSVNWKAVREAPLEELAKVIESRGMNNILAGRIKDFLDRIVEDHGSINMEWLRDVPEDKVKAYLLSIPGLGLKSVECLRLLALHQHAFPVDTNVGRILVRLGWVPLQPLPEDVQIHLLNQYPMLDTIQKYIWPRLSVHDILTLYELHYQLITFGKVFCTKMQPNCNPCPMRGECKHFASAFASSKLRLQGSQGRNVTTDAAAHGQKPQMQISPQLLPDSNFSENMYEPHSCEPIVEIPPSPEPAASEPEMLEMDMEDIGCELEDNIPTIRLNLEELTQNVLNIMENTSSSCGESVMSNALVALSPAAASIPMPKLKYVDRLRTIHHVYELPDSHPLLTGFEKREPDDPCPFLLAIWTTGDATNSSPHSSKSCNCQKSTSCDIGACCSGDDVHDQNDKIVQGTILIPCRTANRGAFPLNGTYFQVNEVFADRETSLRPISVPRDWIWNLRRRILYCGTTTSSIFKGLSMEDIQYCFWRGFICVRDFDRGNREARTLSRRFHVSKSRPVGNE